jgi:L-fuconolactonase
VSKVPAIDAHQHFWGDVDHHQTWRKAGHEALARPFLPYELAEQLARLGIDGTVAIQSVNTLDETHALLDLADQHGFVRGVVGWVPLDDAIAAAAELARFDHVKLKGIRHLISTEPDPDWVVQGSVIECLGLLAEHGLTFDVISVSDRHLEHVVTLAEQVPGLRIVIDHLARPPLLERRWEPWASLLAAAAESDQVYVKLSAGIDVVTDWPAWSAGEIQPYVEWALECFGPQRTMFASNWPVVLLAGSYDRAWRETNRTLSALDDAERAQVLGGTAVRFYELDQDTGGS